MEKKNVFKFLIAVFGFGFLVLGFSRAQAATLYFSPANGSYSIGSTISAGVYVSSLDQSMNAASGVISFPKDKLEVVSLSQTGSIMNLWVQEPTFSNDAGTASFEGIVLNPGFTGSTGKILTLNFKVKKAGSGQVTFSSGSVLANDGKGTNILESLGNASFSLETGAVPVAPAREIESSALAGVPQAPKIVSSTHPDSEKWYSKTTARFSWDLPKDAAAARLLIGKIPDATPTITYSPAISEKEVSDLEEGVLYFHVRLKNSAGWGKISHFKLQVDTTPPEPFKIEFPEGKETENTRPKMAFETTDSMSGIDYYQIKINDGDFLLVSAEAAVYNLWPQSPGRKTIIVRAYDRAGNYTEASDEFTIKESVKPAVEGKRPMFLKVGSWLIILVVVAITLLALFYFLWHLWRRFSVAKKRLQKEVRDVDRSTRAAFNLLREDVRRQVRLLEKTRAGRELTVEEEKIISRLKKDLDETEKLVKKEIKDIEEELK